MRTDATTQGAQRSDSDDGTSSVKVLLVSDCIENFPRLKTLLRLSPHAVTYVPNVEALPRACQDFYDLIVVDVGPEHLVAALREIRASAQLENASVLVRTERLTQAFERTSVFAKSRAILALDSEQLAQEFALTSVFTKYRALPGLDTELARLVSARMREKGAAGLLSPPSGHAVL
jgi:CheY-like chemotaxis protein